MGDLRVCPNSTFWRIGRRYHLYTQCGWFVVQRVQPLFHVCAQLGIRQDHVPGPLAGDIEGFRGGGEQNKTVFDLGCRDMHRYESVTRIHEVLMDFV